MKMNKIYYFEKGFEVYDINVIHSYEFYRFVDQRIDFLTRDNKRAFVFTTFEKGNFYSVFIEEEK